jgi:predicted regulator of Ras-like GTPase activity (Roadblock/LC7/MglB family)
MTRLTLGNLERVLMEGEHGIVGMFPITPEAGLALLIQKDAKLGLVLHAARRATMALSEVLKQEA